MRPRRRLAALLSLAGMLFLQVAIAFAPCELPGRSAAMGMVVAMAAMPGCHEAGQANLCLAHCTSEDQTVIKVQLDLPDLGVYPSAPIRVAAIQPATVERASTSYVAAAGPPPRIRFQSFLL